MELVFSVGVALLAMLLVLVVRGIERLEAEVKQVTKQLYGWRVEQRGDGRRPDEPPVNPRVPGCGD